MDQGEVVALVIHCFKDKANDNSDYVTTIEMMRRS